MESRSQTLGFICLFSLYIFWGSTFLGIRFAVETVPPFLVGAFRHSVAGIMLLLIAVLSAQFKLVLNRREIRHALFVGILTAGASNGLLTIAGTRVPSSLSAICFTAMPLAMGLLNWLSFEKIKLQKKDFFALALGFLGSYLVLGNGVSLDGKSLAPSDLIILIASPTLWALGSLFSRRLEMPKNILASASVQMIGGGIFLLLLFAITGGWEKFNFEGVSRESLFGLAYLTIGGSLIGHTAFALALRNLTPRLVGTYAFVNPLMAVFLGFLVGEKIFDGPIVIGAILSITSVVLTFRNS